MTTTKTKKSTMLKAKVQWMSGDRVDGYYYVGIEGTDLCVCNNGHPDFPLKFREFEKSDAELKKDAQKVANEVNRQIRAAMKEQ